jgi:hypothetical protein
MELNLIILQNQFGTINKINKGGVLLQNMFKMKGSQIFSTLFLHRELHNLLSCWNFLLVVVLCLLCELKSNPALLSPWGFHTKNQTFRKEHGFWADTTPMYGKSWWVRFHFFQRLTKGQVIDTTLLNDTTVGDHPNKRD